MSASHTKARSTATKRIRSKDGEKKPRLTILPGVGLIDLDDPAVAGKLAERLAGKVGEQLVLFAQRMHEGLLAASVAIGLDVMAEFMEAEVTEAAGPKGKHNADRSVYRHGHEDATVALGGRRVPVRRPRVRSTGGRECHLESYETFASADLLTAQGPPELREGVPVERQREQGHIDRLDLLRHSAARSSSHTAANGAAPCARPQPTGSGGRSSLPSNKSIRLARLADPLARCS